MEQVISLSQEIYQNIHVITFLYKPTEEFKRVFSKVCFFFLLQCIFSFNKKTCFFQQDMFVKSNPKAFPHIMQYLFNILNEDDFRKRFFWPILDKNSENLFR